MLHVLKYFPLLLALSLMCIEVLSGAERSAQAALLVRTPSSCHTLEKVQDRNVYLKSPTKKCSGGMSYIPLPQLSSGGTIKVFIDGKFWMEQNPGELSLPGLQKVLKSVENPSKKFAISENRHKQAGEKAAQESYAVFKSPEFQKQLKAEQERLKKDVFAEALKPYYADGTPAAIGKIPSDERVYIFISSSMPRETIRTYLAAAERLEPDQVIFVLRGFVGGIKKFKPTLDFIRGLILKNPNCDLTKEQCEAYKASVQIDPLLYSRYGITAVPTFVHAKGLRIIDATMSEGAPHNSPMPEFSKLEGDVSLVWAVETLSKEPGGTSLGPMIQLLRGGFYGPGGNSTSSKGGKKP